MASEITADAAVLNALLDAQSPKTEGAVADYEASIRANPNLMAAARGLYEAAKAAAPMLAGAVGGPGAGAIAALAVGILERAEKGASGAPVPAEPPGPRAPGL